MDPIIHYVSTWHVLRCYSPTAKRCGFSVTCSWRNITRCTTCKKNALDLLALLETLIVAHYLLQSRREPLGVPPAWCRLSTHPLAQTYPSIWTGTLRPHLPRHIGFLYCFGQVFPWCLLSWWSIHCTTNAFRVRDKRQKIWYCISRVQSSPTTWLYGFLALLWSQVELCFAELYSYLSNSPAQSCLPCMDASFFSFFCSTEESIGAHSPQAFQTCTSIRSSHSRSHLERLLRCYLLLWIL